MTSEFLNNFPMNSQRISAFKNDFQIMIPLPDKDAEIGGRKREREI